MGSATKETKEEFEQRREQARREQSLPEGTEPEQRPVASQQIDPAQESAAYQQELDEGVREPADKKAFDRANSDAQAKKAEKESKKLGTEHFREGDKVTIVKPGDAYDGAVGVIDSVTFDDPDEAVKARSGVPGAERFAEASDYIVKTRAQGQRIAVKPDEVEAFNRQLGVDVTEK